MIEELKFCIDQSEDNPKIKALLLKVAAMPESKQADMLKLLRVLVTKYD